MQSSNIRKYAPLVAIVAVIAVVGVIALVGGDDEETAEGPEEAELTGYEVQTDWGPTFTLPEGVIPFSVAEENDLDIDWPDTCDTERGTAAVPSFFAPDCFAPFDGDNGGPTARGVTEDTIRVVLYQAPDEDAILDAIAGAVTNDTPEEVSATYERFLPFFEEFYETYGREVELIVYEAEGTAIDEVAARAAAAEIAEEIEPFAVWGGPLLTGAFADELAARGILSLGGAVGDTPEYFEERDPYLFNITMGPWQVRQHLGEYIGKRLSGRPAEHAGDEAMHDQERVFGLIYLETGPESDLILEELEAKLAEYDEELAAVATYANPLTIANEAPGFMAQMRDAGVTTLILTGDPLSPAALTQAATDQEYFPEWILSGSILNDTATFARTYDQEQWANAFGISTLAARTDPARTNARHLFEWYNCDAPPAHDYIELVYPTPAVFYAVLQGVGPNLTHEAFRDAIFSADPTPRALTNPSLSWGTPEKGRWNEVDYQGIDDATELWWDPDAVGPDENLEEGQGLYAYVDGGERYLIGEWPDTAPDVFDEDNAVHIYDEPPEEEAAPDYPSPCE